MPRDFSSEREFQAVRNILTGYPSHEGNWPSQFLPARRKPAREKFADVLASDPQLAGQDAS